MARTGALSSLSRDPEGYPYGSLVTVAADEAGRPLLLLSELAEHTGNLAARPEASILLTEPPGVTVDPPAAARVTILGPCKRVPAEEAEAARLIFLAAHAGAARYEGFKDFAYYRIEPIALRYVGGFGRMAWVSAEEYRRAEPDPIAPSAPRILAHMNKDHTDALLAYAQQLAGVASASASVMTAVDRYGFDMSVTTPEGARPVRLGFDAPVSTTDEVRRAMIALVKAARGD
jgi:heme iron utilization protein